MSLINRRIPDVKGPRYLVEGKRGVPGVSEGLGNGLEEIRQPRGNLPRSNEHAAPQEEPLEGSDGLRSGHGAILAVFGQQAVDDVHDLGWGLFDVFCVAPGVDPLWNATGRVFLQW